MDASEAEGSTQNQGKEEGASSAQGDAGARPKKASLKRAADAKAKKKHKKARVSRPARPGYTVHQGEDMLLVISSSTSQYDGSVWTLKKKKGSKKKKLAKGKGKASQVKKKKPVNAKPKLESKPVKEKEEKVANLFITQEEDDHRWGHSLPEEVLINIFQIVVIQEGAVPFLCRVGRVCRLWNAAASSPILWHRVTVGHCWIAPGRSQLPKTQKKIKDTLDWLAHSRFSQLRDFSLCHWTKNVDYALEVVSQYCPDLCSLKLSYCTGVTAAAFRSLGLHSRSLHSLNLQYSERGCCPDLEMLEVNTKLDSKDCQLPVCIQALQMACPKLKTFRMMNVQPLHKGMRFGIDPTSGFPLLEELCIATTSFSYLTDRDLRDILFDSPKLRVLDLRGCSRITASGLAALPCLELECLFWGQYFSSHVGLSSLKKGLHTLTQKWSRTLQQLDIAHQLFTEEDLELAMSYLCQAEADTLRSLNLSGTRITPRALR
uniref:F-box and leucine rich repeat protein 6 n=1 Tax=Haplochromis burtoni TaxID=8153 RepID=A0A3Q2WYV4_HAPBU